MERRSRGRRAAPAAKRASCFSRTGITTRRSRRSGGRRCGSRNRSQKNTEARDAMKKIGLVLIAATVAIAAPHTQQTASKTRSHVETLASERFEGRLAGSNGERLAAGYLVAQLQNIGAKPLPGYVDFLLPFDFTAGTRDGGSS